MPYVDNRGVRIEYRVCGEGDPLVLVHGWSCEGRYWGEFGYVSPLSDEYTVIVPDLRGHGDSEVPADRDFSDGAFASDVIAVMDDLGADSATVFGYSLGGWVVFELAATHASRVRSAVVGGAHPYEEDLSPVRGFSPNDLLAGWKALKAPLSEESRQRIAGFDPQLLMEMIPDRQDDSARLENLQIPWLLVSGSEDWRFEDMRRFARSRNRCKLVVLEGADHLQAWLQSERVVSAIREFLRSSGTAG